mmetsp:Transcript_39525/g.58074  ORF Transcript_39525/g.58074 Transcript_39525/m.58074 type:complete len:95 (+) Transcript_39525:131-415(+)
MYSSLVSDANNILTTQEDEKYDEDHMEEHSHNAKEDVTNNKQGEQSSMHEEETLCHTHNVCLFLFILFVVGMCVIALLIFEFGVIKTPFYDFSQ